MKTIDFPKWNPQLTTQNKILSGDFRIRYKALRNSSSGFIKRKDVRNLILEKYLYECVLCNSKEDLQVNHITSVYLFAIKFFPIEELNTYDNLNILCKKCNCSRSPNEQTQMV